MNGPQRLLPERGLEAPTEGGGTETEERRADEDPAVEGAPRVRRADPSYQLDLNTSRLRTPEA